MIDRQAMNEELRLEMKLRTDDEYFWDYFSDDIDEAVEKLSIVRDLFHAYDREFDIREIEELM